ncbi:hypothetical protein KQX54_020365 [Cotesia glomerata]|uniref:Uncharacterized protein n=1 Tax=Cotesia glomerata TaxID=32391 RepID=A0AAV7IRS8_COTGL|nr:hypothetical protein KQX54_020365 [Cotesia glomerata]
MSVTIVSKVVQSVQFVQGVAMGSSEGSINVETSGCSELRQAGYLALIQAHQHHLRHSLWTQLAQSTHLFIEDQPAIIKQGSRAV